jgi:peptide-methionine (S)-S-oxide reductase
MSKSWCALCVLTLSFGMLLTAQAQNAVPIPAPLGDRPKLAAPAQTIVLAGGCFWGIQGLFQHVRGVRKVVAGYAGGDAEHATYAWVSSGQTAHAEAVQVSFDPAVVSLGELLQIFFAVAHDPTQLNQQWPDQGPQYRSAIFYADATQQQLAADYIALLSNGGVFRRPIATHLAPLAAFYPAEAYHQDYLLKYPRAAYIVQYDLPKLRDLQRVWPERYRERAIDSNGVEQ